MVYGAKYYLKRKKLKKVYKNVEVLVIEAERRIIVVVIMEPQKMEREGLIDVYTYNWGSSISNKK